MQKYFFNIIIKINIVLVILIMVGCNEVFEKNISNKSISLIIPYNGDTIFTNLVHFKWNEMIGAKNYNLQIVKPKFTDINEFTLDSIINGTECHISLNPGSYQFRIRGENSAYESNYADTFSIYIDSVNDLTNQTVNLTFPVNEYYTNNTILNNFSWQGLFSASFYKFQIRFGTNFNSGGLIYEEASIYLNNYAFTQSSGIVLEEGNYVWGVKAINETSSSSFATNLLYIDTTSPNSPYLIVPGDDFIGANNSDDITLKWSKNGTDQGIINSDVYSIVEISENDSLFSSNIETIEVYNVDSLVYSFDQTGEFWWRVLLKDVAGNSSEYYSYIRKITIP